MTGIPAEGRNRVETGAAIGPDALHGAEKGVKFRL